MANVAELVRLRAGDPRIAIRFEDESWTWDEYVQACAQRAAYLLDHLPEGKPPHVGVLLDNTPEYLMWLGATALTGTVLVGINPTRRGAELARDITHTDCQVVVTEERHLSLLDGLDLGDAHDRVIVVDEPESLAVLDPYAGAPLPEVEFDEGGIYNLLFTSGTSGAPKACVLSQRRLVGSAMVLSANMGLSADDVFYMIMPLFHSNAVITAFAPWVLAGSTAAVRRRFSASGFLPDVRRYGVTYFNYVGKPLSYILATPEQPDDADNPVRLAFGNEAADLDIERFGTRFGCAVVDGYGSTEGGANVSRGADMPKGVARHAGRGHRRPRPRDPRGDAARAVRRRRVGSSTPTSASARSSTSTARRASRATTRTTKPTRQRVRNGWYWSGDLGYRDEAGLHVLRRSRLRVDAGRRRELRGRPDRAHPRPARVGGARGGVRGARRGGRRPGDGDAPRAPGDRVRPGGLRRVPRSSRPTSARSGRPATCASPRTCPSPRARSR